MQSYIYQVWRLYVDNSTMLVYRLGAQYQHIGTLLVACTLCVYVQASQENVGGTECIHG